jgi:hypothetical protein
MKQNPLPVNHDTETIAALIQLYKKEFGVDWVEAFCGTVTFTQSQVR